MQCSDCCPLLRGGGVGFPRRCAPLIAPSSRFDTPNHSFQKEGTTWQYEMPTAISLSMKKKVSKT